MDANGSRFWLVSEAEQWALSSGGLAYDHTRRTLQLVSARPLEDYPPERDLALDVALYESLLAEPPVAIDDFGNVAWRFDDRQVRVAGAVDDAGALGTGGGILLFEAPPTDEVTDLALGPDGVLTLLVAGQVELLHVRGHWEGTRTLEGPAGVRFDRVAVDPEGGAWVIDRASKTVARWSGMPIRDRAFVAFRPDVFRPDPEIAGDVTLDVLPEVAFDADERPVAIACSARGRVGVLCQVPGERARFREIQQRRLTEPVLLDGVVWPVSLTWVGEAHVAVMLVPPDGEALREVPVYAVDRGPEAVPMGERYPLREGQVAPFAQHVRADPHYRSHLGALPLRALSLPRRRRDGQGDVMAPLDSGDAGTVWHRVFLEADLPSGCGVRLELATSDNGHSPSEPEAWHPHDFGTVPRADSGAPRAHWLRTPSELPFHEGWLGLPPRPGRCGLFSVLVQRSTRRVRDLVGRYLHIRAHFHGTGAATPRVAALRVYGPRFSYVDQYLPEIYREQEFGRDADAVSSTSTPADFLQRFTALFEGVLTPLEDRVRDAWMVTDPTVAPSEGLDWLAQWMGLTLDPALDPAARRRVLAHASELARWRGTIRGLRRVLDLVLGEDTAQTGSVVLLEDWRLRRTWATILGADLAEEDDPLLVGWVQSGNSYVGDTLVLGDEQHTEFLALFGDDVALSDDEQDAVQSFYERTAHRLTVLVHVQTSDERVALIRSVVERWVPATVQFRVHRVSRHLLVGVAALVGVDTHLGREPSPRPVRIGRSQIGLRDVLKRLDSLDPRLEGDG